MKISKKKEIRPKMFYTFAPILTNKKHKQNALFGSLS
jgi:hypothetical protein